MVPAVGRSRSAITRISVVLPQPEGPMKETKSSWAISRSTLDSACTSPSEVSKVSDTPRARTAKVAELFAGWARKLPGSGARIVLSTRNGSTDADAKAVLCQFGPDHLAIRGIDANMTDLHTNSAPNIWADAGTILGKTARRYGVNHQACGPQGNILTPSGDPFHTLSQARRLPG